jgi:hypothetical protein
MVDGIGWKSVTSDWSWPFWFQQPATPDARGERWDSLAKETMDDGHH